MHNVDVTVIGAGPAGSMAGALLLKEGVSVRIVERERFPRFVIGESLLPRCMDLLAAADLLECVANRRFQVKDGALFIRGNDQRTFRFDRQFTQGWEYTWQVPREEFDHVLVSEVEARGADVLFEHSVEDVRIEGGSSRVTVRRRDGTLDSFDTRYVIDASGYGRVLPRLFKLDKPSSFPSRRALFTHVRGDLRPSGVAGGRIWICVHPLSPDVWIWVIPFAHGVTSVGVVGPEEFFDTYPDLSEETLRTLLQLEPQVGARLGDATFLFPPRSIAGYASTVSSLYGEGFVLVGNATEFLDPIFSSGVTLAFESAHRAAHLVARALRGVPVDWEEEYAAYMRRGIDVFRAYVTAWYDGSLHKVVFHSTPNEEILRRICSILAGYVWDLENPFVADPERRLRQLVALCEVGETAQAAP